MMEETVQAPSYSMSLSADTIPADGAEAEHPKMLQGDGTILKIPNPGPWQSGLGGAGEGRSQFEQGAGDIPGGEPQDILGSHTEAAAYYSNSHRKRKMRMLTQQTFRASKVMETGSGEILGGRNPHLFHKIRLF